MDEAPLLTYGANHSDGRTPFLDHAELHARGEPALGQLHLQMHCGLIKVDHLIIRPLMNNGDEVLHELQLVLFQLLVLGHALPETVVWPLVLDTISEIVPPKCHWIHSFQSEVVHDDSTPLPQAQMAHALQCFETSQPLDLLLSQDPLSTRALDLHKKETP